jgi:anti-anti-sigma factor
MSQCHDLYDFEGYGMGKSRTISRRHAGHECRFETGQHGRARTLRVFGRLDWATADGLQDLLLNDATPSTVVIDLSEAKIDSAGTGRLLSVVMAMKGRSQSVVVVTNDVVQSEVFDALRLSDVVPVYSSLGRALSSLEGFTDR